MGARVWEYGFKRVKEPQNWASSDLLVGFSVNHVMVFVVDNDTARAARRMQRAAQ
jgi:hypothetical protein